MSAIDKLREALEIDCTFGKSQCSDCHKKNAIINEVICLICKEPDPQKLLEEIKELRAKLKKPIAEYPDVQRLIKQTAKLQLENNDLKKVLQLVLNENFSGQSTLSSYAARQAKDALNTKVADQTSDGAENGQV